VVDSNIPTSEITGTQQVGYLTYDGKLHRSITDMGTFTELRALRKDPTVALGRGLLVNGIQSGSWGVEKDEGVSDEVEEFIKKIFLPLRAKLIQSAVSYGRIDYGFAPFEKIFTVKDGRLIISEFKELLVDMTSILVDPRGHFAGFRQTPLGGQYIDVPYENSFLVNFDVEAGNLYGYPLLENVRAAQTMWDACNDGAERYDLKLAGAHWVIRYPVGNTTIDNVTTDNYDMAMEMLGSLISSGSIVIPSTVAEFVQELNRADITQLYTWQVELIETEGSGQAAFGDRLKYLDSLKIRGLILPERSMLEGMHGTKAEAGEHIGLAVTSMQMIDRTITQIVNEQAVDQLLLLNFGPQMVGKVRLVAAPLVDLQSEFLRKLYLALVPTDGVTVDTNALKEELDIPINEGVKPEEKEVADEQS